MPASRSLIALLVGTVAFFALWIFALKGNSSSNSSSSQGVGQYQADINKAHHAVQTSNASNAASGNDATPSSTAAPSSSHRSTASGAAAPAATAAPTHSAAKSHAKATAKSHAKSHANQPARLTPKVGAHNRATLARLSTVQSAISRHQAVAMLFYNPAAVDDVAVKQELASIPTHRGRLVKLTIPLSEAANFTPVTQQVPVNFSPTLVLIAPSGQVGQIVGFSDQFEIAQRVDDALATR